MKVAKATREDLDLADELCSALEAITATWGRVMPSAIAKPVEGEDSEAFDLDDEEQCKRLAEYFVELGRKASLFRVAAGMEALLHPENAIVDPDQNVLALHPRIAAAMATTGEFRHAIDFDKVRGVAERHGIDYNRLSAAASDLLGATVKMKRIGVVKIGIDWTSGQSPDTGTELYAVEQPAHGSDS